MKMAPRNFGHTDQRGFRVTKWGSRLPQPKMVADGRFEVFECGFSRGRYADLEAATQSAVARWGGYVIDQETGERVV